ncbi:MAG: lysophospholipid acyltransferase family protein [Planctomycetota bacterium]
MKLVHGLLNLLPGRLAYGLADLFSIPLVFGSWYREKRVGRGVHRNLRIVYREQLTDKFARRLRWSWARHMMRLLVDFARMPRLTPENLEEHVDLADLRRLQEQIDPEQGLLCITGHMGVAELTGHVAALDGMPVTGVFRDSKNSAVAAILNQTRASGSQKVLTKWGSVWPMKKALDRGEVVGLAADEYTKHKPVFVPFLGTIASTSSMPAMLQHATGLPMAVVSVHRVGCLRYKFHLWDLFRHEPTEDREADAAKILTRMNAALSASILAYPEQWFWGGRRFRINPPGVEMGSDGLPPAFAPVTLDGPAEMIPQVKAGRA